MIRDQEFWKEIRRKNSGGNTLFKCFLQVLHMRQANLALLSFSDEHLEKVFRYAGEDQQELAYSGKIVEFISQETEAKIFNSDGGIQKNDHVQKRRTLQFAGTRSRLVSPFTVRALQRILLFAVPIYKLRYTVHAMTVGTTASFLVDNKEREVIRLSDGSATTVCPRSFCASEGCATGKGFLALLGDSRQEILFFNISIPISKENAGHLRLQAPMHPVRMIASYGNRLGCLTNDKQVLLPFLDAHTKHPLFPFASSQFICLGPPSDAFIVGEDSLLYKVGRDEVDMSSPRSILPLARTPISRVASGYGFFVAIDQCGRLLILGSRRLGVVGVREPSLGRRLYHIRQLSSHFFVQVAAGYSHALALSSSGHVYGCGSNEFGQLGMGFSIKKCLEFSLINLPQLCDGIAAGPAASIFALRDGTVYTCGENQAQVVKFRPTTGIGADDTFCDVLNIDSTVEFKSVSSAHLFEPTMVPGMTSGVWSDVIYPVSPSENPAAHLEGRKEIAEPRRKIDAEQVESPPDEVTPPDGHPALAQACGSLNKPVTPTSMLDKNKSKKHVKGTQSPVKKQTNAKYSLFSNHSSTVKLLGSSASSILDYHSSSNLGSEINDVEKGASQPENMTNSPASVCMAHIPSEKGNSSLSVAENSACPIASRPAESTVADEGGKVNTLSTSPLVARPSDTALQGIQQEPPAPVNPYSSRENHSPFIDKREEAHSPSSTLREPINDRVNGNPFFSARQNKRKEPLCSSCLFS